jgi:(S)-2-hydroxyglutarate dehydrogenase
VPWLQPFIMFDLAIVGGGIVGLASARAIQQKHPALRIVLLEKEADVARHQTGNNSGVVHSGIYYKPGSLKARLCVGGTQRMYDFCAEHGIAHRRCGKVIVATSEDELARLDELLRRALANGVPGVERIDAAWLRKIEPHSAGIAALWSPNTGIADYKGVCQTLKRLLIAAGGEVRTCTRVDAIAEGARNLTLRTTGGDVLARRMLNCGGLRSDDIARMLGLATDIQIVPFRGEYYFIKPERRSLVNGLIYPVPDPNFPFLGVHFTITVHGDVEAGPNAVLAFAREGYKVTDINVGELSRTLNFPGFQKLARTWWRTGSYEYYRSFSKAEFVRSLQKLVPEIRGEDIVRGGAGVRAQAVGIDGALVDDFKFLESPHSLHVLNAPSPAATAALSIGDEIAARAAAQFAW